MLEPSDIHCKGSTGRSNQTKVVAFLDILIETEAPTNGAQDDGLSLSFKIGPGWIMANHQEFHLQGDPFA